MDPVQDAFEEGRDAAACANLTEYAEILGNTLYAAFLGEVTMDEARDRHTVLMQYMKRDPDPWAVLWAAVRAIAHNACLQAAPDYRAYYEEKNKGTLSMEDFQKMWGDDEVS